MRFLTEPTLTRSQVKFEADEKTQKELSEKFANNIIKYGIPGSGHTHANHPIYDFVMSKIDKQTASKLESILSESRIEKEKKEKGATSIQEIKMEEKSSDNSNNEANKSQESYIKYMLIFAFLILFVGIGFCFILNAISFAAVFVAISMMRSKELLTVVLKDFLVIGSKNN